MTEQMNEFCQWVGLITLMVVALRDHWPTNH